MAQPTYDDSTLTYDALTWNGLALTYDGVIEVSEPEPTVSSVSSGGAGGAGGSRFGSYTNFRPSRRDADKDVEPDAKDEEKSLVQRRNISVTAAAALLLMED